ncbi:TPA: cupin [Legionella pneumophila]|uniref:Cupin n=1 Tax=Legionella pneumophila TaxID=446 RepID=A0A4T1EGW2_LEGPN|nr:cupin [Legionella pneumophila]HAT9038373.1 cupin [Legionella pneumophila subsp. pneumophila]MCO1452151.1 cupin [Legionella pneumophila]MCZ4692302.1 cupin [Legionella pneumophila]MCZ4711515.1 cupin [Legionella pneumophila]MCZ4719923.1 cupin [Legionella pneumophila]
MNTQRIPKDYQHISPAGAEVRLLMSNHLGGMAHCTLKAGIISKAVRHKTVSEFWHVLSGEGAIWRKLNDEESITPLTAGVSIDIPLGTQFQYRSDTEDLVFICITMPPWTGSDEASYVEQGAWQPTLE